MAADEWRSCVDWLVRCQILPEDHKATRRDANAFDLAQALRDGSVICRLLNQLSPMSVDVKEFSPRPQMSEFLCVKNIRTFLQTGKQKFGLQDGDLFQPNDLFDVKDFKKVLETLSVLSKTDLSQQKTSGFPSESQAQSNHHADGPDNIYGKLSEMALENDLEDTEELYTSVYQDEDDEIYENLCGLQRKEPGPVQGQGQLSRKEHCLNEMIDTEKNYVDALQMIETHFIKPFQTFMKAPERKRIFAHIQELLVVHKSFYEDLKRAVKHGSGKGISSVFVDYKKKLLVYGDFCSNLPAAQEMIDKVNKDEITRNNIKECEQKANEGRFQLRDLLLVPMQRVLKYPLLLLELIRNTEKEDPDQSELKVGLEAMQDLSLYVNEVKRDHEMLQLIEDIQSSIVDLRTHLAKLAGQRPKQPASTSLKDYGRIQKDGELKVLSHMDSRVRNRHIFLLDKVILMCKAKGEMYSFKDAIVLGEYKVDDSAVPNERNRDKWSKLSQYSVVLKSLEGTITFFAKTEEARSKWIEALQMALENTQPSAGPNYVMQTFDKPRECDVCGKLLRGVFFQGYICQDTKKAVHKECIGKKPEPKDSKEAAHNESIVKEPEPKGIRAKAVSGYSGFPPPVGHRSLKFNIDETIEVLDQKDKDWWLGRIGNEEGYFPANCVKKLARKPSYIEVHSSQSSKPTITGPSSSPPNGTATSGHSIIDVNELKDKPWYMDEMDREAAQVMLDQCPDGTFLIRKSINRVRLGAYSLSIKYANAVRHIKVDQNAENKYFLAEGRYFDSVPLLVQHYQNNSLRGNFPDVNTTLMIPIKNADSRILGYAIAIYDYAATSTTQVSLKENDPIAIISKYGSDKGWWKGQNLRSQKIGYFPLAYVHYDDD